MLGQMFPEKPAFRLGKGAINQVAYSPDGKLLAVAGSIGIWLYDAESLTEVGLLETAPDHIRSLAFSPDGKILAAGSEYKALQLWDVEQRRQIVVWTDHWGPSIYSVAFSPDGKILAAGEGRGVHLRDVPRKKSIAILRHEGAVSAVAFSPDGRRIASVDYRSNTIHLWSVQQQQQRGVLAGHTKLVRFIAFSPDGRTLASGSSDGTVRLWEVITRKQIAVLERFTSRGAFSPDGKILALGGEDILLWDVQQQKSIGTLACDSEDGVASLAFSPDNKRLAVICGGNWGRKRIDVWDVALQKRVASLEYMEWIQFAVFSPDGKTFVTVGDDIRLWDTQRRERMGSLQAGCVHTIAISPDGNILASAGGDNGTEIGLWDVQEQKPIGVWEAHPQWVSALAFHPGGRMLASVDQDGIIRLWDVGTQKLVGVMENPGRGTASLLFTPDGKMLISNDDTRIRLWDVETQQPIGSLGEDRVYSLALSPDGRTLASGRDDIYLWDIQEQRKIAVLNAPGGVNTLAFSPDGKFLATGSGVSGLDRDAFVRVWDVNEQKLVAELQGYTGSVFAVAFSPDGKWLASGARDGTTLFWEVNLFSSYPVEPAGKQRITLGGLKRTMLLQNFPNPFNPETWIPYQLAEDAPVTIRIYDAQGRLIHVLDLGQKPAGIHLTKDNAAYWDGRNERGETVPSGLYFYRLNTGDFSAIRRMLQIK